MTDLHLASQTTKKYDLPLSHLDYNYVEKCTNVNELEKILRVLRSGDEGKFPELERFTEKRLETLNPKSRLLRKDGPILKANDLSSGDWQAIEQDLQNWTNDMHTKDQIKSNQGVKGQQEIVGEGDENLPPVRSSNVVLEGKKQKKTESGSGKGKTRVMPRDYGEWDKFDIDAELEKVETDEGKARKTPERDGIKNIKPEIDAAGMSHEERELKASREKDKGNEAYRSGDYDESVTYYSRSISLIPNAASFNNRALAYLKLEKWDLAVADCNSVLNLQVDNIKALLRRGTAYKSKKQLAKAREDFEKVLRLEPNNKKAESLLEDIEKEEKDKKEKGRRMVIEEVEEESEAEEEVEVEKPVVNGYSSHEETGSSQSVSGNDAAKTKNHNKQGDHGTSETLSGHSKSAVDHDKDVVNDRVSDKSAKSVKTRPVSHGSESDPQSTINDSTSSSSTTPHQDTSTQSCSSETHRHHTDMSSSPRLAPADAENPSALSQANDRHQSSSSSSSSPSSASLSSSSFSSSSKASAAVPSAQESRTQMTAAPLVETSSSASSPPPPASASPEFVRPRLVHRPLSPEAKKLKEDGNNLFRSGQYGNSAEIYSKVISRLEKDSAQVVNLSQLLSNRAACHLKTGNCRQAIADCDSSLGLVPHGIKSLMRRAAAFESLEKYSEAYRDYKHALSVDSSIEHAYQGVTRCQNMLQEIHGQRGWREKVPPPVFVQPWEVPEIVDEAGLHRSASSSISLSNQAQDVTHKSDAKSVPPCGNEKSQSSQKPETKISTSQEKPAKPLSKEEEFEKVKAAGNQHVQKGEFQEAAVCYSTCISLCPGQVACYTNRALCYLKLTKAVEAEADCDKALALQASNPKALYRRALARKMLHRYKLSLQDLVELLKLEPKNTAAKKEMDTVKQFYKEELDQLKQRKLAEAEPKVKKRMKIEEVDEEEEEERPVRGKASDKPKSQAKSRGVKSSQPTSVQKSKPGQPAAAAKQPVQPQDPAAQGLPSAPRLMKTTPYEFCQAWNSLRPCQGIQPYAEILKQISPGNLPSVISNKLDGQMLQIIVRCVYEEMVMKGGVEQGYQVLDNLCKVPRFSTVSMFMSSKEKKEVSTVLDILCKTSSSAYSTQDIVRLKKEYSVK